ncbi:ATP-binding protein [Amycolatopsis sp. NPDC006131]|uniref:ATP-binding protein n=1 Tax=Amycolatopsis sp. NPDC006131 TaxID=3156731 RepID=UPI0033AE3EFE
MSTAGRVLIRQRDVAGCTVVDIAGRLNAQTYGELRDNLIKLTLDQPRALIVQVDELDVVSEPALTVFSSVRMRTDAWPAVPVLLVVHDPQRHRMIAGSAIRRFVPVHSSLDAAVDAVAEPPPRRRRRAVFLPLPSSSHGARAFVQETCREWNVKHRLEDALGVTTELVENAITHAGTALEVRLELHAGYLTVAVRDEDPHPAVLRQRPSGRLQGYGLQVISALSRAWGCSPAQDGGKIVWAVLSVGPRRLAPFPV